MSDMSVVTNNNFAHTSLAASFCTVFILTMKSSDMSLHAVESDNFFFPFVKLLREWGEKHKTLFKINCEACLSINATKPEAYGGSFPCLHGNMERCIPAFLGKPSYEDECHLTFSF